MKKENWATDFLTNLAKIYADDVEVIEIIEDTINVYGDYVAYVHKMESLKPILKIKLGKDEYKNAVDNSSEYMIDLIIVFIFQTILLPIIFLYVLYVLIRKIVL